MSFRIIRNDITKINVDAVVNSTNPSLYGTKGVDGAIHRIAGPQLVEACSALVPCPIGETRVTPGFGLNVKYIIHAVGPLWEDGTHNEEELLQKTYQSALSRALELRCDSIAFPLISTGTYGFPRERAFSIAFECFHQFLEHHDMEITLVVYDKASVALSVEKSGDIQQFIDNKYVEPFERYLEDPQSQRTPERLNRLRSLFLGRTEDRFSHSHEQVTVHPEDTPDVSQSYAPHSSYLEGFQPEASEEKSIATMDIDEFIARTEASFSATLLNMIDRKGMTDVECYKHSNIDRKLFSKIRSDPAYKPKKQTVLAFAIGLRLNLQETEVLLKSAGYALTHSSKADLIVEYFILKQDYNIFNVNQALFQYEQPLLCN